MRAILKLSFLSASLIVGLVLLVCSCTAPTRTVYNTLYSVEATTTAAVDSYYSWTVTQYQKGNYAATNDTPKVSKAFDKFQSGFLVAIAKVNWQSNTVAPFEVIADSLGVRNLILQLTGGSK